MQNPKQTGYPFLTLCTLLSSLYPLHIQMNLTSHLKIKKDRTVSIGFEELIEWMVYEVGGLREVEIGVVEGD